RRFNRRLPIVCYDAISATTVITNLISAYAPGFTTTFVQAALPAVTVAFDGSKTMYQCLEEIAAQIGDTHFYLDALDLHFFTGTDPAGTPGLIDENNTDLLLDPPVEYSEDVTQLRTRVFGKGAGAKLIADLTAGDDTIFVDSSDLFDAGGGDLFVAPCQVIHYTGKSIAVIPQYRANLTGAFSGLPVNTFAGEAYGYPTVPYTESKIFYLVTQVRNGVESNASQINVTLDRQTAPAPSSLAETGGGSVENGISYTYYSTLVDTNGNETEFTGTGASVTVNSPNSAVTGQIAGGTWSSDARIVAINLYRKATS